MLAGNDKQRIDREDEGTKETPLRFLHIDIETAAFRRECFQRMLEDKVHLNGEPVTENDRAFYRAAIERNTKLIEDARRRQRNAGW